MRPGRFGQRHERGASGHSTTQETEPIRHRAAIPPSKA